MQLCVKSPSANPQEQLKMSAPTSVMVMEKMQKSHPSLSLSIV